MPPDWQTEEVSPMFKKARQDGLYQGPYQGPYQGALAEPHIQEERCGFGPGRRTLDRRF